MWSQVVAALLTWVWIPAVPTGCLTTGFRAVFGVNGTYSSEHWRRLSVCAKNKSWKAIQGDNFAIRQLIQKGTSSVPVYLLFSVVIIHELFVNYCYSKGAVPLSVSMEQLGCLYSPWCWLVKRVYTHYSRWLVSWLAFDFSPSPIGQNYG